jgi:hypothetical protein
MLRRRSGPRRPRMPTALLLTLGLLGVELVAAGPAAAQSVGSRRLRTAAIERRIDTISPTSGPPGTLVRVETEDMPVTTPVRVGIGAMGIGFEAFDELLTGQEGDFAVTLEVPQWATWDRAHLFVVFDIYFGPIALSDYFHVTNSEGLVRRDGQIRRTTTGCAELEDREGLRYALLDLPDEDFDPEERMIVEGRIADGAACGNPMAIEVVRVR